MATTAAALLCGAWLPVSGARADGGADKRCADIPASVVPLQGITFKDAKAQGAHGCLFRNVVVPLATRFAWTIEAVSLDDMDLDRVPRGRPPPALKLRLDGVRQLPQVGRPYMLYAFRYSATPFTIALDYRFDEPGKELRIDRLAVSGDAVGLIEAAAVLTNIDPSTLAAPPARSRIALRSARLHVDNRGFMERFVVMPAAAMLLGDAPDPDAKAAALKREAVGWLQRRLTSIGTRPATIDALAAFVQALPVPHKVLDLKVDFTHPVAFEDMFDLGEGGHAAALGSLGPDAVTARFGP